MRFLLSFLIIAFFSLNTFQVNAQNDSLYQGNITIYQDSLIDSLLILHKKYNKLDHRIEGYRIQVFFESGNNSSIKSQEFEKQFLETFPEINTYISFREPFYRVRVGDYKTKLEADQELKYIRKEYPNAWVIKDRINYPKIETENSENNKEALDNMR